MGFLDSIFGKDKEEVINNNKEVYRKFLFNYAQNPTHEYLKQLTVEAGQNYYASKRKNGKLTSEDEETILQDLEKAVMENASHDPNEEAELRRLYEDYRKKEAE